MRRCTRNKDQGRIGCSEETRIQSFFMLKHRLEKQRIRLKALKTVWVISRMIKMRLKGNFVSIFKSYSHPHPKPNQINAALQGLNPKVSTKMNNFLEQPYTVEEITTLLTQMCPTKAPGPDRL